MSDNDLPMVVEEHVGMPAKWDPNPFKRSVCLFTSIDEASPGGKERIMRCSKTADFKSDDVIGQKFKVQDVLCHVVSLEDPASGECVDAIRTVLVDPDGSTYGFVSKGVFDSLTWMGYLWGPPPWPGGRTVTLVQESTRNKRRILKLDPVE